MLKFNFASFKYSFRLRIAVLSTIPFIIAFSAPLNVDQLLSSTYVGGRSLDGYCEVPSAIDPEGNIYIASRTYSSNYPVTSGAYSDAITGSYDICITKLNNDLSSVLASTFIGGSAEDGLMPGVSMALDKNGNVYVAGQTVSSNFPVTEGAFQTGYGGGGDVFIVKMDPDLTELKASTYLGGSGEEGYIRVAVGDNGDVYATGTTSSSDFPTTAGAIDRSYNAGGYRGYDLFIAKMDSNLTVLNSSTYLGGNGDDFPEILLLDDEENLYFCGWTASSNYPTTSGAYSSNYRGGSYDAFISKVNSDLTVLSASTFFGGSAWDFGYAMTLDEQGNIYLSGHTASTNLPTTAGAFDRSYNGTSGEDTGDDVYIAKFDNSLSQLFASSYLGGSEWENSSDIAVADNGEVIVTGMTSSSDFPVEGNYYSNTYSGGVKYQGDVFITAASADLSDITYSSYFGGESNDNAGSLSLDNDGNFYIAGSTGSTSFPVTSGAFDESFSGGGYDWGGDMYVSKFNGDLSSGSTPVRPENSGIPFEFRLYDNYPNPFNPETTIIFGVDKTSNVNLSVYDIRGKLVRTIVSDNYVPGEYSVRWNGINSDGKKVSSGIYFYRLAKAGNSQVKKMLLLK
ncbi:SBBP repeat-containing protein [candidate division KSB1 bacterium]